MSGHDFLSQYWLLLILSQHPYYSPLYVDRSRRHNNGLHVDVGRLQPNLLTLAIEALQRSLCSIDERDHNIAVVRRPSLLDQYVIAVENGLVLHRITPHLEYEHFF